MTDAEGPVVFEFGGFRLEPHRRLLSRIESGPVIVSDKAFEALVYLVERAGKLVTKHELLKALWPATVVEENNLYVAISTLRQALKDESGPQRLIATVAGRGYQFVAEVREVRAASTNPAPPSSALAPLEASAPTPFTRAKIRRPKWAVIAAMVLAFGIGTSVFALRHHTASRAPPHVVELAVLPFKPLTREDRNESLELGMAETLIAGLNTGKLSVSPLSSVRRYGAIEQDMLEAGRALGVQAVLEGHIQRDGSRLRVSVRLLDVGDGRQLWAERYDEPFTDIFSVQDTIAAKVRAALTAELDPQNSPVLRRYTRDSEAYQFFANGRFHLLRLDVSQALQWFHRAVERDPNFALAYVGIAEAHSMLGVFGAIAPHDTFPQARQAVDKALQLAPDLGEAYASLGHIKMQYESDGPGAERAYRRAMELSPNYARTYQWHGLHLAVQGRFDEGIAQLRKAQELEPSQPLYSALIGMVMMYQRRYDEAIRQLRLTREMDPDFATTNTYLAAAYLRQGEYEKALDQLSRVKGVAPGSAAYLGQIHALSGRRDAAFEELERLRELSKERYVPAYDVATIYAALGEVDETYEWLDRAFEERSQLRGWLLWDPVFDGMRGDARYAALVKRVN